MNETSDYLTANGIYFDFNPASIFNNNSGQTVHDSDQLRVIATDKYLIGWYDRYEVVFIKELVSVQRKSFKEWEVICVDDDSYTVTKANGCGCGSNLKSFHPFAGIPFLPRP